MSYDGPSPLPVKRGGTGAATLTGILTGNGTSAVTANAVTQHGVLIGGASNAASSLAVASTGTVLAGSTGADPSFTATPSLTSITLGAGSALSTYVTGTWTPGVSFGGGTTGITYSTQTGAYVKIGQLVMCTINLLLSSKGSSTGTALLTGLPFTSLSSGSNLPGITWVYSARVTFTTNYTDVFLQTGSNVTTATLAQVGPAVSAGQSLSAVLNDTNFNATTAIVGNLIYIANA